jgi:hypothetical protein
MSDGRSERADRVYGEGVGMRWLDRDWVSGKLDDAEWNRRLEDYLEHREEVRPLLRNGAELLDARNLHDAQIRSFDVRDDGTIATRALVGDLQVGYAFLDFVYRDARVCTDPDDLLPLNEGVEILYDEVDAEDDGRFVHRVLLSSIGHYEVSFGALSETSTPATAADRNAR